MGTLIDRFMEFGVEGGKIIAPAPGKPAFPAGIEHLKPLFFQRGHSYGAQSRAEALELRERLVHVGELIDVDLGRRDTLSRRDFNQSRAAEPAERLADRRPRYAKLPANTRLVNALAGLYFS